MRMTEYVHNAYGGQVTFEIDEDGEMVVTLVENDLDGETESWASMSGLDPAAVVEAAYTVAAGRGDEDDAETDTDPSGGLRALAAEGDGEDDIVSLELYWTARMRILRWALSAATAGSEKAPSTDEVHRAVTLARFVTAESRS